MTNVYRLKPRAVAHASAVGFVRNCQAWYALGPRTAMARRASMVTGALREMLGSDPNSAGLRRQRLMPGTGKNKPSLRPSQPETITHEGPGESMGEPVSLSVTAKSEPKVRGEGGNLIVVPRRDRRHGAADKTEGENVWTNAMLLRGAPWPKSNVWQEETTPRTTEKASRGRP